MLTLEQVYEAIAFYLANRADIDALAKETAAFEALPQPLQAKDPNFYEKLIKVKQQQGK
ncbi:MAG: hypothetical protein QNJ55_13220 [Xenococcus sp. MO_188.B8]|nr:hypothetical protein [Xenococcus sp. MO_188.B8]